MRAIGRRALSRPAAVVLALSMGVGVTGLATSASSAPERSTAVTDTALQLPRHHDQAASRSSARAALPTPSVDATPTVAPTSTPTATPTPTKTTATPQPTKTRTASPKPATTPRKTSTPKPTTTKSTRPTPVGGLDQTQMNHAAEIVRAGQDLGLPARAYTIAIATAIQESSLYNLANYWYPESLDLPHDGVGGDHDSIGLFQQRPSTGWGSVDEIMDPETSATKFYRGLMNVYDWQDLPLSVAAQSVQVSAFPDAYAQHEDLAIQIVNALT